MIINNNMMAKNSHRMMTINASTMGKSTEKLSSGLRVNRAADDAAGLSISEKMRGQIRGLTQASRNAQDAISVVQTAEGALDEAHSILQRMRQLAVQSANDSNVKEDRAAIQKEVDQLTTELDRIATVTEFNTQKLLDGSFQDRVFHVGANKNQKIEVSIKEMSAKGIGLFGGTGAATPEEIGKDIAKYSGSVTKLKGSVQTIDGKIATAQGKIVTADGKVRLSQVKTASATVRLNEVQGKIDKYNSMIEEWNDQLANATTSASVAELKALIDGKAGSITALGGSVTTLSASLTTLEGSRTTLDEKSISVLNVSIATLNHGKGGKDAVLAKLKAKQGLIESLKDELGTPGGEHKVNVSTQKGANRSIKMINDALTRVSDQRSTLGAIQNRMEHTIRNLDNAAENTQAAESRVRDLDMAKEMSEFTKKNILTQASQAMLAQANQLPQQVLQLLR